MNREHDDVEPHERADGHDADPVEMLRAADPAAGVEPSAGFVDEVVARATDEVRPVASDPSAASPVTAEAAAPVADLGTERARRRPRWLPIAAAAASVAIVGAAGFWAGSSTNATNLASSAAPPISLQGVNGANGAEIDTSAGAPEMATGFDQKMMGGAADSMIAPYGWGRNVFSASGLSNQAGTAGGYAYDSSASGTEARIAALAAELGVEGEPVLRDGNWVVGPQDGTAPSLTVGLDGTLGFWFNDPAANPWNCGAVPFVGDATLEGSEPVAPVDPIEPCEPSGTVPGEAAAVDALRSLITAAGADPAAFEYSSDTWEGSPTRYAQAWPVIDGQRLDQGWSLELAEGGVVSASGQLAEIIAIGDYPIVSEQEGFERLSDPRFGAQMTAMPFAAREGGDAVVEEWVPPTAPPTTPGSGAKVSWPVNEVEIVEARLGLTTQWQPDGSVLVVPAYEFTDAEGGTWSVIAVADSALDFSAE